MAVQPWLPRYRHLLGKVVDAEIARLAGVSHVAVLQARRKLGIQALGHQRRQLDDYDAEETLELIRARARAGKSMLRSKLNGKELSLAERHFGGWYAAVKAAGLEPLGKDHAPVTPKIKKRPQRLTLTLLKSSKTAVELERLTAVPRTTIVEWRNAMGIFRQGAKPEARAWKAEFGPLFGKKPDAVIARMAKKSVNRVMRARQECGLPPYRDGRRKPKR
jgi:hypothetical protein